MAAAKARPDAKGEGMKDARPTAKKTPFERFADLTRRIVQVPKSEAIKGKKRGQRKRGK